LAEKLNGASFGNESNSNTPSLSVVEPSSELRASAVIPARVINLHSSYWLVPFIHDASTNFVAGLHRNDDFARLVFRARFEFRSLRRVTLGFNDEFVANE